MIQVRSCTPLDVPRLGSLMAELLHHYDMPVPGEAEIRRAIAAQLPEVDLLLALDGESLLGFASYAVRFRVWAWRLSSI